MTAVSDYARIATSMATIGSILSDLGVQFSQVRERTPVDDSMIDALVAASAELTASAEALKQVTFQPPAEG